MYLKVKPHTIHVWTHAKKIPYEKAGHLLRFRQSDIDAWLKAGQTAEPVKAVRTKPGRSGRITDIDEIIDRAKRQAGL